MLLEFAKELVTGGALPVGATGRTVESCVRKEGELPVRLPGRSGESWGVG